MTIFSVDVETSGLNPIIHDVTAISVIERDTLESVTFNIDPPYNWDEATMEWAAKNIPDSVNEFPILRAGHATLEINAFLDKFPPPYTFMAWPASFDFPFCQKLWSKDTARWLWHYRTIDIHSLLVGAFGGDIASGRSDHDLPGIVVEPAAHEIHNPYFDALAQLKTYNNIMQIIGERYVDAV